MIKKLMLVSTVALGSLFIGPEPAQAQSTPSVHLLLFKGNTILKSHAMTSVEWHGDHLFIYGAKEANGANRYFCVLRSTKQDVLLGVYRALTDPKLATKAVCRAPATHSAYSISVDLENQSTTKFGLSGTR